MSDIRTYTYEEVKREMTTGRIEGAVKVYKTEKAYSLWFKWMKAFDRYMAATGPHHKKRIAIESQNLEERYFNELFQKGI